MIVHDAGGAEIIGAYIRVHKNKINFESYVAGPAVNIFMREKIPFSLITDDKAFVARAVKKNIHAKFAILGARWRTDIESTALSEAKINGIRTVVYMDSWSNYRERFGYPTQGWENNLPDELWLGDKNALQLALSLFPKKLKIKLVPNEYFRLAKKRYVEVRKKRQVNVVLFLTDPSTNSISAARILFIALSRFVAALRIRLRLHPSDQIVRYVELQKEFPKLPVEFSREPKLANDLASSLFVVGAETVALAVAAKVGLPVFCVAPNTNDVVSNNRDIVHVRTGRELTRQLRSIL